MNTDYQDIKSYKKPNVCGNLCPNISWFKRSNGMTLRRKKL